MSAEKNDKALDDKISKCLSDFNKYRCPNSVKLVNSGKITVKFEIKTGQPEDHFSTLKMGLAEEIGKGLEISSIVKKETFYLVSYSLSKKGPADEILDVLKKYNKGTLPEKFKYED